MTMRWMLGLIGLALSICLAAYALDLPPLASPTFYRPGKQLYLCHGGEGPPLFVTFSADGLRAEVETAASKVPLRFSRLATGDTYKAQGWVLTLDPEANLSGPNGFRASNCA